MKRYLGSFIAVLFVIGVMASNASALVCGNSSGSVFCNASASVNIIAGSSGSRSSGLLSAPLTTGGSGFEDGDSYTLTTPDNNGVQVDDQNNSQMQMAVFYE